MPRYKLVYFDFKNRGELIRLIFATAGVEFEDYRIPLTEAAWNAHKPRVTNLFSFDIGVFIIHFTYLLYIHTRFTELPFNKVPVLEIDGRPLPQTKAIAAYLAREFGITCI